MAEKIMKSRIINKHDTEANWLKATNFIPKQGEMIVYDVDDNYSYERFKIGDGTSTVTALPFFMGDVDLSGGVDSIVINGKSDNTGTTLPVEITSMTPEVIGDNKRGLKIEGHLIPAGDAFTYNYSLGSQDHVWDYVFAKIASLSGLSCGQADFTNLTSVLGSITTLSSENAYINSKMVLGDAASEATAPNLSRSSDGAHFSVTGSLLPSATVKYTLGAQDRRWLHLFVDTAVFAGLTCGESQFTNITSFNGYFTNLYSNGQAVTSDRDKKCNIEYVTSPAVTYSLRGPQPSATAVSQDEIVDFVRSLQPATYIYKKDGKEQTMEEADTIDIQLGLIADDICEHSLFKYIGTENTKEEIVQPEVKDEAGNVVQEAITENVVNRGLKPLPLAVAALTTCKHLLEKIEILEERINLLESGET